MGSQPSSPIIAVRPAAVSIGIGSSRPRIPCWPGRPFLGERSDCDVRRSAPARGVGDANPCCHPCAAVVTRGPYRREVPRRGRRGRPVVVLVPMDPRASHLGGSRGSGYAMAEALIDASRPPSCVSGSRSVPPDFRGRTRTLDQPAEVPPFRKIVAPGTVARDRTMWSRPIIGPRPRFDHVRCSLLSSRRPPRATTRATGGTNS